MLKLHIRKMSVLFFILSLLVGIVYPNEIDALFTSGNKHYQDGDYIAAIADYEQILNAEYESWEVYYNLGNAYYKNGQIASAILSYERAKKINPKNEDLLYNLELANLATADQIQGLPRFFLVDWVVKLANVINLQLWGTLTISIYIILLTVLVLKVLLRNLRTSRVVAYSMFFLLVVFFVSAGIFSFRVYENETLKEAIVITDKVDVKSAPNETGTDVFTLHQGVKVKIDDQSLEWIKIKLADGKVGWLNQTHIKKI